MKIFCLSLLLLSALSISGFAQLAFPHAEGFGAETRAAYGGKTAPKILTVTSYDDIEQGNESTGEGTLRWCLTRSYPRIVLFQVGGTFKINSAIQIRNPYLSLYGQSAPSPGVLIIGTGLDIRTHDVLIQHIAVRPGDDPNGPTPGGRDGIELRRSARNVIIDHCSLQWAIDENLGTWADGERISRVTFSHCIIAEGLENSLHNEGPHSKGLLIALHSDSISVLKNYIAHNGDRNPYIQGGTSTEVINNLIYNGKNGILFHDYPDLPTITSVINNHVYKGYNFTSNYNVRVQTVSAKSKFYLSGNSDGTDGWDGARDDNNLESSIRVETPPILSKNTDILKRSDVVDYILSHVGTRYWSRDSVDKRIINSFINRTGRIPDCVEGCENSAGGWFLYENTRHTLNIPKNPHADTDESGFTNLEEWVYSLTLAQNNPKIDNAPIVDDQFFAITDQKSYPQQVGVVLASDPDSEPVNQISILSGNEQSFFSINPANGMLSLVSYNVGNYRTVHQLLIEVVDNDNPMLKDTASILVEILPQTKTVFIDPSKAADINENGTIEHPYHSWKNVQWSEGYQYLQKKGTTAYETDITIGANNIVIGSYGDGDAPQITSSSNAYVINAFDKYNISIQGLTIRADDAVGCLYFLGNSTDLILVENCVLDGADNGIRIIDGKQIELRYNTFRNLEEAIYSIATSTKVYYSIFRNNTTAVNISSNTSNAKIFNNIFFNNELAIKASYAELTLRNNIFYFENSGQQAINHNEYKLSSDHNIFYPEQPGFIQIGSTSYNYLADFQNKVHQDINSRISDPMFVNAYDDMFSVSPNSPAIDAGQDVGLSIDFFGGMVPAGGITDIGLAETAKTNNATSTSKDMDIEITGVIYPNPSNGRFLVKISTSIEEVGIEIKNLAGKTVLNMPGYRNATEYIDISDLPKGVYLVKIIQKGITSIEKAVIY